MEGVVGSLQSIRAIRVVEEEGMCVCESEWRGVFGSLQSIRTIRVVQEEGMCVCESEWRGVFTISLCIC